MRHRLLLLVLVLLLPAVALAQGKPQGRGPGFGGPDGPRGPGGHGGPGGPGGPDRPPPPPQGWPGRQPPPPPGPDMPPPGWEPSSELLALVEKEDPEFWQNMEKLKGADEDRFRIELFRWTFRHERMQALRREDPERAKLIARIDVLERQVHGLVEQIRGSGESGSGAFKEKLASLLSELFDKRQEDRRSDIAHLEKRLVDLKGSVEDRRAHKDEIVRRRMKELLGGEDSLRW